jgi:hypothetical protein
MLNSKGNKGTRTKIQRYLSAIATSAALTIGLANGAWAQSNTSVSAVPRPVAVKAPEIGLSMLALESAFVAGGISLFLLRRRRMAK